MKNWGIIQAHICVLIFQYSDYVILGFDTFGIQHTFLAIMQPQSSGLNFVEG
jgi:hypothetical protein